MSSELNALLGGGGAFKRCGLVGGTEVIGGVVLRGKIDGYIA
jgi:hypothetical protein